MINENYTNVIQSVVNLPLNFYFHELTKDKKAKTWLVFSWLNIGLLYWLKEQQIKSSRYTPAGKLTQ